MPLTPYHVGPGILVKALLRGGFSLMIFSWAQVLVDLQPLVFMITGAGVSHGWTHTYLGATLIAAVAAASGRYGVRFVIGLVSPTKGIVSKVPWAVAFLSALLGSYSHVAIDSLVHADVSPWWPFAAGNPFVGLVPSGLVQGVALFSGVAGIVLYFAVGTFLSRRRGMRSRRVER